MGSGIKAMRMKNLLLCHGDIRVTFSAGVIECMNWPKHR
jgi:hypothetical protein